MAAATPVATPVAISSASLLATVSRATVLSVQHGQCTRVSDGELRVLSVPQAGGEPLVLLTCGESFSYPLIEQPVLRSGDRVFILPAEAQMHYVVNVDDSVAAESVVALERALREATLMRDRPAGGALVPAEAGTSTAVVSATARSSATTGYGVTATQVGESVATAIVFSGKIAAQALVAGAELAGRGVQW